MNDQYAHCIKLVSQFRKIQIINALLQISFEMRKLQQSTLL